MRAWLLCFVISASACESTLAKVYGGFSVENAAYCETSASCLGRSDGNGKEWICDTLLHTCLPPDTCLSSEHSCQDPEHPICADGLCIPCSNDTEKGDTECQARADQRRDDLRFCTSGACHECRNSIDCPRERPVCAAQSCRACREHADCESGICRTDDALRELPSAVTGTCVEESQIVYVDADRQMSGIGTKQSPISSLADAMQAGKPFLLVRPTGGDYGSLDVRNISRIVVGQRVAMVTPKLSEVIVTGGSVVLSQITVVPKNGQDGLRCAAQAELTLRNVSINGPASSARGLVAEASCLRVDVHASRFTGISGSAITLSSGSVTYRIVNSAFRSCGSTNPKFGSAAVVLGQGARGVFTYNTLYQNLDAVECSSDQRIDNTVSVGGSLPGCTLDRPDLAADLSPEQLQLLDTPRNHACCIDQAIPDPSVSTDSQGTPRPQGSAPDRGHWEG